MIFNVTVAVLGSSLVNPLSPRFLAEKWAALGAFARHRGHCFAPFVHSHPHRPFEIVRLTRAAAKRHGVDADLLVAIVETESHARPHRISPAGAMGAAQLTMATARALGVEDPFDPRSAVDASARLMKELLARYRGNVTLAAAAYNAGPGAVRDRVPENGETEHYVRKVMTRYRDLAGPRARATGGGR
jgi:hypothetical protein